MQMSRWDRQYSEFQDTWKQVKEANARLIITKDMEADQLAEIARLKRVIEYVDGVQKSGAKDVMPFDVIKDAKNASTNIFSQINHYNSNPSMGHIHNANSHLDRILSLICPFVTNSKESAQAAGQAFGVYRKVIEKSTEESKTSVDEIKEWHGDISKKYTDITAKHDEIDAAHNLILVNDEEGDSIQTQVNEHYNKIKSFYRELLKGVIDEENEEDNKPSIRAEIEQAKKLVLENVGTVQEETEELQNFYEKIFGTKIEEGERVGEREGGLKQEIDDRKNQLNEYENEQQDIIKKLQERIEGLLPGATSAGLATAFRELKEQSEQEIQKYTKLFYRSLIILSIIAFIAVLPELCYVSPKIFGNCEVNPNGLWLPWARSLLAKSLFVVPALWFAIFASKRRSEHQRLQQEYAHKESVSKSFDGYKQQIMALGAKDETLLAELIEAAIKAIDYNASITLGGKHGDSPPITEALKAIGLGKNSN